jgi:translation initiation factor eIF-2B subunit epsilon
MVKDGSHVPLGCLIAEGVVIGPDAMLVPYERLSAKRNEIIGAGGDVDGADDDDDDDSDIEEVEASELNHSYSL